MTRLPGEMRYEPLNDKAGLALLYEKMEAQGLLWAAWPEVDEWTEDFFVKRLSASQMYVLGGFIDGMLAGALVLWPFGERTLVAEVGVTAFRPHFRSAPELFLGALRYILKTFEPAPSAFMGRVAACHHHALRMLEKVGFEEVGRVPGLLWHTRKQTFVDGVLVMATPAHLEG